MFKRPLSIALVLVAVPLFGGVAYAATQSVSSEPSPKVVIPARSIADDHGGTRNSSADPTSHDANDDKGGLATLPTSNDPATHDVGDDHGGATATNDDPATHDAGDDHGGTSGSGGGN